MESSSPKRLDAIFKAYDIRGLVPDELDEDVAYAVGRAFADFLGETDKGEHAKPVAVGRDMREDSSNLAQAVTSGITQQGRDVLDVGRITTDMMYFATGHLDVAGGMVITASHNPGAYNGIKLAREDARAVGMETGLRDIKEQVVKVLGGTDEQRAAANNTKKGSVAGKDITGDWVDHALEFAPNLRPLRIAVDAGNGMAGVVIPHLQGRAPLEITPLYFELDGTFPNHEANPSKSETLVDLQQAVITQQLDLGIAFDGDGDRMLLVDENGETVSGSVTTALLARYFLQQYPGSSILHNAITSRIVPETIEHYGGKPVQTKVGHSYINAHMRRYDAPFGGEHSAHYYFRDNWYADSGLIAALTSLQVLSDSGQTLSALAAPYRDAYCNSEEINFHVADPAAMIEHIAEAFPDGRRDRMDGLTVSYPDWWFNVRPSNTEPLLRLNVEAGDAETLQQQKTNLEAKIGATPP
jgi:phosphomannomutase